SSLSDSRSAAARHSVPVIDVTRGSIGSRPVELKQGNGKRSFTWETVVACAGTICLSAPPLPLGAFAPARVPSPAVGPGGLTVPFSSVGSAPEGGLVSSAGGVRSPSAGGKLLTPVSDRPSPTFV